MNRNSIDHQKLALTNAVLYLDGIETALSQSDKYVIRRTTSILQYILYNLEKEIERTLNEKS